MMKETVDEDEIEALVGRGDVGGSIMGFESNFLSEKGTIQRR
jgi:hypothetical protein